MSLFKFILLYASAIYIYKYINNVQKCYTKLWKKYYSYKLMFC